MNTLGVHGAMARSRPCREVTAGLPACARASGCVGLRKVRTGLATRPSTGVMFSNLLEAVSEDALPALRCAAPAYLPDCRSCLLSFFELPAPIIDLRPQTRPEFRHILTSFAKLSKLS